MCVYIGLLSNISWAKLEQSVYKNTGLRDCMCVQHLMMSVKYGTHTCMKIWKFQSYWLPLSSRFRFQWNSIVFTSKQYPLQQALPPVKMKAPKRVWTMRVLAQSQHTHRQQLISHVFDQFGFTCAEQEKTLKRGGMTRKIFNKRVPPKFDLPIAGVLTWETGQQLISWYISLVRVSNLQHHCVNWRNIC